MINLNDSFANSTSDRTFSVQSKQMPISNVPDGIKHDVTNITTILQNKYGISIQDSQFLLVNLTETNGSSYSYNLTTYVLMQKIDSEWYLDSYLSYSIEDWAAGPFHG